VLSDERIRFLGNVEVGRDITLDQLHGHYDAVIFSTGSIKDAALEIPGIDLPGSYGAADFVSWYDAHPDVPTTWPLDATSVAVIGNGNVALDVARVLAKHVEDMDHTDIPPQVREGLAAKTITDVHVFGRRGPAQSKFSPLELRELGEAPDVDIITYADDFQVDASTEEWLASHHKHRQVFKVLQGYRDIDPETQTASHRIHLHFLQRPAAVLGDDAVTGLRMERTRLVGDGTIEGTGEHLDYEVQQVYRAVGYFGSPVPGVPFDEVRGVIPHVGGRVIDETGTQVPGLYATGWIKRGPVGLIGSTKSDARETVTNLIADALDGRLAAPAHPQPESVVSLLEGRGTPVVTWDGWERLSAEEMRRGGLTGREREKVAARLEMLEHAHG
jgi:ferredoxin/flavodoxin---NADP+ reductase